MTIRDMLDRIQHRDGWEDKLTDEWVFMVKSLNKELKVAALDDPEKARDIANRLKGFEMATETALDAVINPDSDPEVSEPEPVTDDGY